VIHKRAGTRSLFSIALLLFVPHLSLCQPTASSDPSGTAFNVKSYGAIGDGKANDTPAIQSAIDAATAALGGIVYFPQGTYLLKGTLYNKRADLVSLTGSGMASRIIVNSNLGISLATTEKYVGVSGFHSGRIQGLYIKCSNPADSTAIEMTDMVSAPLLMDLSISGCNVAFHLINQRLWTERLMAENISDHYNNHLFHFDQNPDNPQNSFGYAIFNGIFVNKSAGQDVFYLTGGAYIYHSTFTVKGNLEKAKNASIFNIKGKPSEPCPGLAFNVYDIALEGDSYFVVKTTPNGCRPGATGNALVNGMGTIHATGAAAVASPGSLAMLHDPQQAAYLAVPVYTATASSSDTVAAPNLTPSSKCFVQPADPISANLIKDTYVSGTNWQSVTITHPPTARGGKFQIWCTP
jgi:Endopolygalacturonase